MTGLWKAMTCLALITSAAGIYLGARLFTVIQDERRYNTLVSCQKDTATNLRTRDTINRQTLERLTGQKPSTRLSTRQVRDRLGAEVRKLSAPRRIEMKRSLENVVVIVNNLAQVRPCANVADDAVSSAPSLLPW